MLMGVWELGQMHLRSKGSNEEVQMMALHIDLPWATWATCQNHYIIPISKLLDIILETC